MSAGIQGLNDPKRLRDLLNAVLAITADFSVPHVLKHIVDRALEVVDCRYGAVGVLDPEGRKLEEFIHSGVQTSQPLDLIEHSAFLDVPIHVRGEVYGILYLAEKSTGVFSLGDEELAVALARAAGIAIDNALLHDRERTASDLHDTVIQRLFAIGLGLQGTLKAVSPAAAAERIATAITDLHDTVQQIRTTIFELDPRAARTLPTAGTPPHGSRLPESGTGSARPG